MSDVGIMFVGAVLFVNGLLFLGHVDARAAAVFNLFVGALQCAVPFYLIATATSANAILLDAGIFLFGFTYLYVGIINLAGISGVGLGWYSAWVAIMALAFGVTEFTRFHDPTFGLLWLQWSVLWGTFFVVLALGRERWTATAGWMTLIMSFTTCTIPGYLLLLGSWGHVRAWMVLAAIAATAAALVGPALRARRAAPAAPVAPAAPAAGSGDPVSDGELAGAVAS